MHKQLKTRRTNRSEKGATAPTFTAILFIAIILIALAGWAIVKYVVPLFQDKQIPVAGPALSQDAQAAIAGTGAYYTIDYTETADQWADRVCSHLTTAEDCAVTRMLIAPEIYNLAQRHQIKTGSTVYPLGMVYEYPDKLMRIWQLQVTLTNPWPEVENAQTVYAVVVYDEAAQKWAMQRILFSQEAELLEQAINQQKGSQP